MYRVIDTITLKNSWTHRYPELAKRGDGLLLILEPEQIKEAPDIEGRTVTVKRPDGSVSSCEVSHTEAHHGVVGIFVKGLALHEIPHGSLIGWETSSDDSK